MITERMARIVWLHRNTTQPMIACRVLVQQQELQAAAAPSESLHGCANKHTLLRDCTVLFPITQHRCLPPPPVRVHVCNMLR